MSHNLILSTVKTPSFEMDYLRFGSGDRVFVILPGLSVKSVLESASLIARQYERIAKDHTVYLFDRRKTLPYSYPVDDMAADTARAMDALGLRNVFLFGASQGGMIAQQIAGDSTIKANYNILNTVTFGSPLISLGSREGTVKRLGDKNDFVPALSVQSVFIPLWSYIGLNKENGGYSNPITAHKESYGRADVWGRYDVTGTKNGSAKLTLDLSTRQFFKSPIF